ncbi:DNA polymerase (family 10) [Gracilibacillus halotolerans]|uniref:DNA-directed DNA polymerase n=1 Tax=Gracilibacillus halotolerans TaxID=74386 RepID=A0A841RI46_9BACI|nr:DNA polymerase/3'-5' exonuclease PolX [Gracilibacillus halotolerans]MBB6513870.1 DNA polymerase (family 10) [Gracilibacillus halotolerans]
MSTNKKDVIRLLEKIAIYMELKGENPFKISAYRKAAQALERDDRSLSEIDDFTALPGIGKGTAAVITEFIQTNQSETLKQLEDEIPKGLIPLLTLPGLGGKKLSKLYQELQVTDETSLRQACEQGKVQVLKGFGKKTEEKILEALDNVGKRPARLALPIALTIKERVENYLDTIKEIQRYSIAGSMRRYREDVKDLDFIIATDDTQTVKEKLLAFEDLEEVIAAGDTKISIIATGQYPINVDFRLVTDEEFITTLHHFTGSKDHNVLMRQLAKSQGKKISEYGVEDIETNEITTFKTEEDFFASFGLQYIPPEIREGKEELEFTKEELELISEDDIVGDLHMHTTWSDGGQSVEEMVQYARKKGYEYIAITDHSKFLRVANGLTEERWYKQREEIERVRKLYNDIHIFTGIEMDILPDGSLDYDDEILQEIDFVIASIHSSFNQDMDTIKKRFETALNNPHVDMIAHPTGRLLGRRDGYQIDVEWLIDKAKETNTILELNANPNRLDLAAKWVELAQEKGVSIAINTDAHSYSMLEHMKYGCGTARRGKLKKKTVVNTWTKEFLMSYLKNE